MTDKNEYPQEDNGAQGALQSEYSGAEVQPGVAYAQFAQQAATGEQQVAGAPYGEYEQAQQPYDAQPAYGEQPAYDAQPAYSEQPAYDAQPAYGEQPAYDAQPAYTTQQAYTTQPAYAAQSYGQPAYAQADQQYNAAAPQEWAGQQPSSNYYAQAPYENAASAATATGAPGAQYAYAQAGQDAAASAAFATPAAGAHKKGKLQGGAKTFLTAFAGAALACVLILGGYVLFFAPKASVSLGSTSTGTSITVEGDSITLAEAVSQKSLPSVVCINVYTKQTTSYYGFGLGGRNSGSDSSTLEQSSLGSGVILTQDGYVLTNYHVIEGADKLLVTAGGEEYTATIVGSDASSDLAVIKLDKASGLTPIEIGDSDKLVVGEWVMSIGSPFGLEQSVATGIVSATSRSQIMSSETDGSYTIYTNLIQTDAAINPGNSGGALVNANGALIGINTLITSYSGNYSGVGFAIPVNYALSIAQQIMDGKTPSHAQLGVTLSSVTSTNAQHNNLPVSEGAYLSAVASGSAAEKAGLEQGDIITKFGDTKITSATDLMIAVRGHQPGDKVTVTYYRGNTSSTLEVTLGSDTDTSSSLGSLSRNG